MYQLLPIPTATADDAAWQSTLLGTCRCMPLRCGSAEVILGFQQHRARPKQYVSVQLAETRLWIGVEDLDQLSLADTVGVEQISTLPEQILLGVLETLFEHPLERISAELGAAPKLTEVCSPESVPNHLPAVGFCMKHKDGSASHGRLAGDSVALKLVAELVERAPATASTDDDNLPIPITLEIGHTPLPLALLKKLERQDVLMLEQPATDSLDEAIAKFPSPLPSWRVRFEGEQWRFVEPVITTPDEFHPEGMIVRFQRGRYRLPLGTVRDLSAKKCWPIVTHHSVTLSVAGERLAVGELVSMNNRRGVRILAVPGRESVLNAAAKRSLIQR